MTLLFSFIVDVFIYLDSIVGSDILEVSSQVYRNNFKKYNCFCNNAFKKYF